MSPTFVDIQMIPTDPNNLTLVGNVYDWPKDDDKGQIQRVLTTTFATSNNMALRSSAANAGDGELRVVPFLEITIPYKDGHYGNLPIFACISERSADKSAYSYAMVKFGRTRPTRYCCQ